MSVNRELMSALCIPIPPKEDFVNAFYECLSKWEDFYGALDILDTIVPHFDEGEDNVDKGALRFEVKKMLDYVDKIAVRLDSLEETLKQW